MTLTRFHFSKLSRPGAPSSASPRALLLQLLLTAGLGLTAACGEDSSSGDNFLPGTFFDGGAADATVGSDATFAWDGGWTYDAAVSDSGADVDASDLDASELDASDSGDGSEEGGSADGGIDGGDSDAGADADGSTDGSTDAAADAATDAGTGEGGADAGLDAGGDAGANDASVDGSVDAAVDAAVDASADGSVDGSVDGGASFPRPGEAVNVTVAGPYTTGSYSNGVQNSEYGAATVYYPSNARAPFSGVVLCPGYGQTESDLTWLAQMLASHGIVALTLTPTATLSGVAPRVADINAALGELRDENTRAGGPLQGKLELSRLAVLGHGYGGAAALSVANTLGTQLRAVVALASWDGSTYPNVKAAALFMAAEDDVLAPVSSHAFAHYGTIPAPVEKVFAELDNKGHYVFVINPTAAEKGVQTRHLLSFLKIYLEDDLRYETYVYGLEHSKDAAAFSRYLTAP